jgi:F420-non-reducing hydrogenase large subunit
VDENNQVNFYDGKVRVVDVNGKELARYAPNEYLENIEEHVESYSYLKYPYLKQFGWKGFVEGEESGVYHATPLSRLNAADGMATPLAQAEYEKFYEAVGGKPCDMVLAMHWARLIELLYASERALELVTDEEITSPNVRTLPTETPSEGIGIVEAQRGTLTHHYKTDKNGIITRANLIVGTTNNNAPITMSIKKAASSLITKGKEVNDEVLNMIEMAFRAYDPCFSCATHSLPGHMPMEVTFVNSKGEPVKVLTRK